MDKNNIFINILSGMSTERGFFEVIYPPKNEIVFGPLQLVIKIKKELNPGSVRVCIADSVYQGIIDLPYCIFLLPPLLTDRLHLDITLATEEETVLKDSVSLAMNSLPSDFKERPYEFVGAKRDGFVLKREHIYASGPPNELPHRETLELILKYVAGSSVLDVGCGIGAYVKALAENGFDAKGLEVNPSYVHAARERGVVVEGYDGKHLPFADKSFDTVIAVEVLEHVDSWESLLIEMLRVAERRVLVTTPNIAVLCDMAKHGVVPWHILEATHVNFFTPEIWRHTILRQTNVNGYVFPYSKLWLNGESFDMHVFALIEKLVN